MRRRVGEGREEKGGKDMKKWERGKERRGEEEEE